MAERLDKFWVGVAATLFFVSLVGAVTFFSLRPDHRAPLVIAQPAPVATAGEIYISGAVANPGLYPLRPGDTMERLLADAGGLAIGADRGRLSLVVPATDQTSQHQRIDLNRADAWLLEALPGIGPVTAAAIVDYRNRNGDFRMIQDLLLVPGIGDATLQRIKDYVTVGE